jgi:hypothetical protein
MVKPNPAADPEVVARLRALAEENIVSSVAKLHKLAQRLGVKHTTADLAPALSEDVGKQIIAPLPRYRGVSAATGPGSALQADLAVFPTGKEGAHKYFLLVGDVFTRQAWAEPLRYKTAEATNKELKAILKEVPGKGEGATLTTDAGKEFKRIETVLDPIDAVHRLKQGRNDIAVVDRMMQTLKVRLGQSLANRGGTWKQSLDKVVAGYNATPHATVHGAPEDAGGVNAQHFLNLQDQARNFAHNDRLTAERKRRVESLGAFREAIPNGGRSFKPAYGPVRKLKEVRGGLHVIDEEGNRALLKRVQAVNAASAEPQAIFATKVQERKPVGQGRKRAKKPMEKPVPAAASKVFASASGLSDKEKAEVPVMPSHAPSPAKSTGVLSQLIATQKATYQPKRTMAQIQKEAAENKKLKAAAAAAEKERRDAAKAAARQAEKARMAQIRADNKRLDAEIRADEKRRKAARA